MTPANGWYMADTVAANPGSTSYTDNATLNVPTSTGDSVYVFYRAQTTDPWHDYGQASGTFSVTAPPVISVTAPDGHLQPQRRRQPAGQLEHRPARHGPVQHLGREPGQRLVRSDTVAANPASTSYTDNVVLNVPTGTGYSVYVFYRAQTTDPWQDYGQASGTVYVTAAAGRSP